MSDTPARLRRQRRAGGYYGDKVNRDFQLYRRAAAFNSCTAASTAVDISLPYGSMELMTPTATQMSRFSAPDVQPDTYETQSYHVKVRTFSTGLGGVEVFDETTPYMVGSRRRAWEVCKNHYLSDPTCQVRVESMGRIVAVGLYGRLLWLDKVPPPKYWLDYRKKPTGNERMAACGLPIPERYRSTPCPP